MTGQSKLKYFYHQTVAVCFTNVLAIQVRPCKNAVELAENPHLIMGDCSKIRPINTVQQNSGKDNIDEWGVNLGWRKAEA